MATHPRNVQQEIDEEWEEFQGSRGGQRGSAEPRLARLQFPRYNGDEDPVEWLYKADKFFAYQGTYSDAERLRVAAFHLDGDASIWFQTFEKEVRYPTWVSFSDELCVQFGPNEFQDFNEMLSSLRQTTTVRAYYSEFMKIAMSQTPNHLMW